MSPRVLALLFAVVAASSSPPAEAPKDLGLRESARVSLVPLEVTVWPKTLEADACLGLTIDDFELRVNNKARALYAVDSLGAAAETYTPGTVPDLLGAVPPGAMSVVLFFDLWHLDVFYKGFSMCPSTKPVAFVEARRFINSEFQEGDRLLFVTNAGWPVIHYGWLRTRADALVALDRLERNHQVRMPPRPHVVDEEWIVGLESLFLALGRYPGRKDMIYLGDEFRWDDVNPRMPEIAARAQSNGVVVNVMDLLSPCRQGECRAGGLACTEFKDPLSGALLSSSTGGKLFSGARIDSAVHELRSMRKCRYLVSFRKEPGEGKRAPSINLALRGERGKQFTLSAPSSYETAARAPTRDQSDEALFLLPRFGRGLAADVALWPYHSTGKKKGLWKVFVLARVDRTGEEPWPDDVTEIKVSVLLHTKSTDYGQ